MRNAFFGPPLGLMGPHVPSRNINYEWRLPSLAAKSKLPQHTTKVNFFAAPSPALSIDTKPSRNATDVTVPHTIQLSDYEKT